MNRKRNRGDGKVDWLRSQEWWADLPKSDLEVLASTGDRVTLQAGHTVMAEGDRGMESAIIVAGHVEVVHDGEVIARLGPGDVVGELSLLDGAPRNADVRTASEVELLVFSLRSLQTALDASAAVRSQVMKAAEEHRR